MKRLNGHLDADKIVKEHLSIWSETNEIKRTAAFDKIYAGDVRLTDPFFTSSGIEKLNGFIVDLQNK
ncbi:MAG: hypothetical protein H7Y86_09475 [Rhizobacter sp.]|nr:hypothetical protein [Ferruginibacter sp.]